MSASPRLAALAEGLVVVLIFGSTLALAKAALAYLGPLTLSALRYCLAALLLLPLAARRASPARWPARLWKRFLFIGLSFYVVGNGAVFLGLRYLPATTTTLLLNLIPIVVLVAGIVWLGEAPTRAQLAGVAVGMAGGALFFSPGFKAGEPLGIAIVTVGLVGNAMFGIVGRGIARERSADTLSLTAIPLAVGGAIMLPLALAVEGVPRSPAAGWAIVLWLAVVNTACAYLLYNHALRVLAALEMSMLLNLTPLVTALLAWAFLGERLRVVQLIGMVVVIAGVALVQWGRRAPKMPSAHGAES
jgi:drug/metabolite transporter (DMT)-like permease